MMFTCMLMNLDRAYITCTLVLLGLKDGAISLLLGYQSQKFRYLCIFGLYGHNIPHQWKYYPISGNVPKAKMDDSIPTNKL